MAKTKNSKPREFYSPPLRGVILFWFSCAAVLAGFWAPYPMDVVLLAFIIPVFYGAHEALHDTLIPQTGTLSRNRRIHNDLALIFGFALQGMNFRLLRPGHIHHHAFGRYDEGYAPDVTPHKPRAQDYLRYYVSLFGLPALAWQMAGFATLVLPPHKLPFLVNIRFGQERSKLPHAVPQLAAAAFVYYGIWMGGWSRFLIFELLFIFIWSMLQNVAHYGLRGFDPQTDRVCARTYFLERPFHFITYGSTAHLAHHVDMHIPGAYLRRPEAVSRVEELIGCRIEIKYGVMAFLADVIRQIKGPLCQDDLNTSWIKTGGVRQPSPVRQPASFGRRAGRTWHKENGK